MLAAAQRRPDERSVSIMPRRFDEHAPQMGIPGFGDRAARLFRSAGMLGRHEADKRHRPRGGPEPTGVPEFSGDGQRREIVDATETAQALDARPQRLEGQQRPELVSTLRSRATASSTARR
jgi:hypothetical protein